MPQVMYLVVLAVLVLVVVQSHRRTTRSLHGAAISLGSAVDTVTHIATLRRSMWHPGTRPMKLPFVLRAQAAEGVELESVFSCPQAEVHLIHLDAGSCLPGHLHEDSVEIFFPVEGSWALEVEGRDAEEFAGGSRRVGVARSGSPHSLRAITDAAILAIIVPPVFLGVTDGLRS